MLCPFCLGRVRVKKEQVAGTRWFAHLCPDCHENLPALYTLGYHQYPPVVLSTVGFRQHGKTVFFASLFYALKKLKLAVHWPRFYTMGLNEDSLNTVYENVALLEGGELPASTPKIFPRPTMIRINGLPTLSDCTLTCFDTGGECFERPTELVQFAGFVRRASSAMLLISVADMRNPETEMHHLLNTYVVGMGELAGQTREQHLVIVFTKADKIADRLAGSWPDIYEYLRGGSIEGLAQPNGYAGQMHRISQRLQSFTCAELGADEFLNAAHSNFKSVSFSIVSSLGAQPEASKMAVEVLPRRILDPLFWVVERSLPGWRHLWHRWTL